MTARTKPKRRPAAPAKLPRPEPELCPGCLDLVIWVPYVPVPHRRVPGAPLKRACLDWPEVVDSTAPEAGDQQALAALGVTRAGRPEHPQRVWLRTCRHIDGGGLLAGERGYSLHLVTHPQCRDLLVKKTDGEI